MAEVLVDDFVPTGRARSVGRTGRAIAGTTEGRIGIALSGAIVLVLLLGPLIAPGDPTEVGAGVPGEQPSADHLLGTDELGRDVLSRLLTGGIGVIAVPLFAVTIAFLVAGAIGMSAAYRGGRFDRITVRVVDVMLPIPPLLIALVLLTRAEGGFLAMSVVVALVFVPRMIRVLRGAAQNTIAMDYVLAAEARGEPHSRIVFGEMLPNMAAPLFVEYGIRLNFAVVFIASLNFLGFGAQPPSSNWALMVSESVDLLHANPWAAIAPMATLALLVVGVNFITDAATQVVTPDAGRERRR